MSITATVEAGRITLPADVPWPSGTVVRIEPVADQPPTLWETLKDFDGMADDLPDDLAANLDHYLPGTRGHEDGFRRRVLLRGAALNNDSARYWSWLRLQTGVTGGSGDRAPYLRELLLARGYPAPVVRLEPAGQPGFVALRLVKDVPGLDYVAQARPQLATPWQDAQPAVEETATTWTGRFATGSSPAAFYRVRTTVAVTPPPPVGD